MTLSLSDAIQPAVLACGISQALYVLIHKDLVLHCVLAIDLYRSLMRCLMASMSRRMLIARLWLGCIVSLTTANVCRQLRPLLMATCHLKPPAQQEPLRTLAVWTQSGAHWRIRTADLHCMTRYGLMGSCSKRLLHCLSFELCFVVAMNFTVHWGKLGAGTIGADHNWYLR